MDDEGSESLQLLCKKMDIFQKNIEIHQPWKLTARLPLKIRYPKRKFTFQSHWFWCFKLAVSFREGKWFYWFPCHILDVYTFIICRSYTIDFAQICIYVCVKRKYIYNLYICTFVNPFLFKINPLRVLHKNTEARATTLCCPWCYPHQSLPISRSSPSSDPRSRSVESFESGDPLKQAKNTTTTKHHDMNNEIQVGQYLDPYNARSSLFDGVVYNLPCKRKNTRFWSLLMWVNHKWEIPSGAGFLPSTVSHWFSLHLDSYSLCYYKLQVLVLFVYILFSMIGGVRLHASFGIDWN